MNLRDHKFDSPLFLLVLLMLTIGVVMVYSASSFKAQEIHGDSHYYLKMHLLKVMVGLVLMLAVAKIDYRFWLKISPALLTLSVMALLFLLVSPTVEEIRGSKRWIVLGGFQVQPSDFARIALILFLSASLTRQKKWSENPQTNFFIHLAIIGAVVIPILLQPDFGTSAVIILIAVCLMFVSGEKLRYLFSLGFTTAVFMILFLTQAGYHKDRVIKYIASLKGEPLAWQAQQSMIALGNGHVAGLGLGGSRQKYHFLPDPFTDFIYAIVGEELGLIGTTLILVLIIALIWTGFRVAMLAPDNRGKVLTIGIVSSISIYAFINAGVVVSLLPTTGIPMPFLSYGGSSMVANLFGIGVLLNIIAQIRDSGKHKPVPGYLMRTDFYARRG